MRADALAIDDAQDDNMVVVVVVFLFLVAFCYGNKVDSMNSFLLMLMCSSLDLGEEPITFCSWKISY